MSLTIYTVSDPATIGTALNAMAMFFGQEGWVGTAIKTGLLLSLMFILAQGVTRNGLRLDAMLVQLIVIWVMFMPKTTVTVEQFDNAAPPRVVDDIPYAIALPASLAGSFAMYMTGKIEAVMVNVDGDYLSVTGESHPFTPARALMAITMCPSDPLSCTDQNLVETMRLAARYCSGPALAETKFNQSGNVLASYADTMTEVAQVVIYDSANPFIPGGGGGRLVTCAEAAEHLKAVAELEKNGQGSITQAMTALANRAEVKRYNANARAQDNTTRTWDEALNGINKLRDDNSKLDALALANVTLYAVADSMKYAATAPIDQAISVRRDTALFDWAKSEAQTSMLVSATAPKFMDILFFVFIASTPIVMFIVAANPTGGMKVAGSYVLFGMWTQSWVPMMAIVMSWYQSEMRNLISPAGNVFTPEYTAFFMKHAYTTTIAASNMIQQAPYLMFAIMTGSMFALSGMVSKAMPSGKGGGGSTALGSSGGGGAGGGNDVLTPGAKGGIPGAAMSNAIAGGMSVMGNGLGSSATAMAGDGAGVPGMASLNTSGALNAGRTKASELASQATQSLNTSANKAMEDAAQQITSAGQSIGGEKLAQQMRNAGFDASFNASTGKMTTQYGSFDVSAGQTNSSAVTSALRASLGANSKGAALGKIAELLTGLSAAIAAEGAIQNQAQQSSNVQHGNGAKTQGDAGTKEAFSTTNGQSASAGTSGRTGAQWSQQSSEAKKLADTFSQIASDMQSVSNGNKLATQGGEGVSASTGQQINGADVVTGWGQQVAGKYGSGAGNDGVALGRIASLVQPSLSPQQQQQFESATASRMAQMDANKSSLGLSRDQVAAAAAWNTLADMSAAGKTADEKLGSQLAMAQIAKAAGAGDVTAPLQNVRDGLSAVSGVAGNIQQVSDTVKPTVDAAAATANAALDNNTLRSDVAASMKTDKAKAEGLVASANNGIAAVTAAGAQGRQEAEKKVGDASAIDTQGLVDKAQQNNNSRSAYPMPGDQVQYGAGNDTSLGTFLTKGAPPPANPEGVGPAGMTTVTPNQTMPQMIGGAADVAKQAAADITGGLTGGAATAGAAASAGASALSGATQATQQAASGAAATVTNVVNSAPSGLPTLGNAPGIDVRPSGGGGAPATPASAPAPSSKPSNKSGATGSDAQKPKTPGR